MTIHLIDPTIAPTFAILWPTRGKALSPKVEWLVKTDDGYEAEHNYTQIIRSTDWNTFLHTIEATLLHGERAAGDFNGQPVREMNGLYALGLHVSQVQLAFLCEPKEMSDGSFVTEFTLRRAFAPVEEGSVAR